MPYVTTPVILATFVGIWQLYVSASGISPFVLPGPGPVFTNFGKEVATSFVWRQAIWPTIFQALVGFGFALLIGAVLGFMIGKSRTFETVANPFVVGSQVVPQVALIPLFLLWFGFGSTAKIVTAAMLAFFPILTNTAFGVKSIPPGMKELFASMRATRMQRFIRLEIPYTLANMLTGARIGMVMATVGAIVAEYLGGNNGLGAFAVSQQNQLQIPELFGSIVIMAVLGFVLYSGIEILRHLLIPWHESVSRPVRSRRRGGSAAAVVATAAAAGGAEQSRAQRAHDDARVGSAGPGGDRERSDG